MIALRRDDVRDLNRRARMVMRAAGRLGRESIALRGGDFSRGDAIVAKLNDARAGIANGDRGTVVAVDPVRQTLEVDFAGRKVVLGAGYLDAETPSGGASLLHGYAITGHVAQGLTTERTFVLGSDELYREWGYAALSRGRAANHLYTVADRPERDEFAPRDARPRDPLHDLQRALEGSRAQRMASDVGAPVPTTGVSRRVQVERELETVMSDRRAGERALTRARGAAAVHRPWWRPRGGRPARAAAEVQAATQRLTALRSEELRLRRELRALARSVAAPATEQETVPAQRARAADLSRGL